MSRPSVLIPVFEKHTASLIFLHGLGDVGQSWLEEFKSLNLPKIFPYIKFIFPTAPTREITINNGMLMTGWFDSYGLDRSTKQDTEGIIEASKNLNHLIEQEIQSGISAERIIIAGFSQGGACAFYTALTTPHKLAGVIAMSTWLPLMDSFSNVLIVEEKKANLPILQCHGNNDPIVRLYWARLSEERIKSLGFKQCTFKEYESMTHTSSSQEMKDITAFIQQYLPSI